MANLGRFSNCVLLTGAGLSRNWGGLLASELWGRLLGNLNIQRSDRIRLVFLGDNSYENVYARVEGDPEIPDQEKATLRAALNDEFAAMHRQMSAVGYFPLNEYGFNEFLLRFCGARENQNIDTAYLFTLNQDLLIESKLIQTHLHPRANACIPGVRFQQYRRPFDPNFAFADEPAEVAFDPEHRPELRRNLNYIKLHGSFGWRLPGGDPALVIGTNKTAQIRGIPLLAWYSSVFSEVIHGDNTRLMALGYSFSDVHINACIADAVRTKNLRLYVWNTRGPRELLLRRDDFPEEAARDLADIYQGLLGCCTRRLDEVFPTDQRDTEDYRTICNQFFLG